MAPRFSTDKANHDMALPDKTHIEQIESVETTENDSIENLDVSWYVWMVSFTASVAGGLFGYDTGKSSQERGHCETWKGICSNIIRNHLRYTCITRHQSQWPRDILERERVDH